MDWRPKKDINVDFFSGIEVVLCEPSQDLTPGKGMSYSGLRLIIFLRKCDCFLLHPNGCVFICSALVLYYHELCKLYIAVFTYLLNNHNY